MDFFNYEDGCLRAEGVALDAIAERFGTPCYIYSRATLERHWHAFDDAFGDRPHLICYAVKANSNLAVLNVLARLGSGFDIVSGGELARVLKAGGDPGKIVFSGVGKTADEIRQALDAQIRCFNVESVGELERIDEIARAMGRRAPVSLRINPDVDALTHPYISTGLRDNKFGIPFEDAVQVYQRAMTLAGLEVVGLDCHIGSQLTDIAPYVDALDRVLHLANALKGQGITLHHLDLGGGLGVRYQDEAPPLPADYVEALRSRLDGHDYEIIVEPGRAIAANAGVLLTRVEYIKDNSGKDHSGRHFAIVDAAMNDLLRPALYGAWQAIVPVRAHSDATMRTYDVVGPVCETGDFLGKERSLAIVEGDLLAVRSAGAYGFTMSSNYNTRTRAAEVMVDGGQAHLVRARERIETLYQGESCLP